MDRSHGPRFLLRQSHAFAVAATTRLAHPTGCCFHRRLCDRACYQSLRRPSALDSAISWNDRLVVSALHKISALSRLSVNDAGARFLASGLVRSFEVLFPQSPHRLWTCAVLLLRGSFLRDPLPDVSIGVLALRQSGILMESSSFHRRTERSLSPELRL